MAQPRITITKDGPYVVEGETTFVRRRLVRDPDGHAAGWEQVETYEPERDADGAVFLCRCGHSENKPFCDGHHEKVGFDGTETASTEPYDELARTRTEHGTTLGDAMPLCAHTGFCTREDADVWRLLRRVPTEENQAELRSMAQRCPSGRLSHKPAGSDAWVEPDLPHEVVLVADGQIHVTGGARLVSSDGEELEPRNRVSLCRCGRSRNKPYCDGTHDEIGFTDEPSA